MKSWWRFRRSQWNVLLSALFLMIIGASASVWVFPHYLAPGLPLLVFLAVQGIRHASVYQKQVRVGGSRFILQISVLSAATFAAQCALRVMLAESDWADKREQIMASLEHQPGEGSDHRQYSPQHSSTDEWVYNRADIDASSVVWAQDLGVEENTRLLVYFKERRIWRLHADGAPVRLTPVSLKKMAVSADASE